MWGASPLRPGRVFIHIIRLQPALHTVTMGLGALTWLAGNGFWLAGAPVPAVVPWWVGFLVLTIVGERLELSRLTRPSPLSRGVFVAATGIVLIGLGLGSVATGAATKLAGAEMLLLALWLLRHDIARYTLRQPGLPRFIAVNLLSGYAWLAAGGVLWILFGGIMSGLRYDAMLHAVFFGFVLAMIFGHAPIILPAVLGADIPFRPAFYVHSLLMNLSLVIRVAADLVGSPRVHRWGGLLNAVAMLVFLASSVRAVRGALTARTPGA